MITSERLEQLLQEIGNGHVAVRRAISLVKRPAGFPPEFWYRVEVGVNYCQHDHNSSWTVIFVTVNRKGIQLMRQRVSSCPVGGGQFCGEVDVRPVLLDGHEELSLFTEWAHQIVVDQETLVLLLSKSNYPFREFPLANSEMRTLMLLSRAIGGLVAAVRKAISDLEATKKMFKSEAVANVRRALDWALISLSNATER